MLYPTELRGHVVFLGEPTQDHILFAVHAVRFYHGLRARASHPEWAGLPGESTRRWNTGQPGIALLALKALTAVKPTDRNRWRGLVLWRLRADRN